MHRVQSNYVHFKLRWWGISQREEIRRGLRFFAVVLFCSKSPLFLLFVDSLPVKAEGGRVEPSKTTTKKRGSRPIYSKFIGTVLYSTLLHLPPLRFHCVGGWRNRTQDICAFGIWLSDALNHSARSHPIYLLTRVAQEFFQWCNVYVLRTYVCS